jgi:hypothetical protein
MRQQMLQQRQQVNLGDMSHLQAQPPPNVAVRASIHIILTEDGRVLAKCQAANRLEFNLMMTTANQDLIDSFRAQEVKAAAAQANGGILVPNGTPH